MSGRWRAHLSFFWSLKGQDRIVVSAKEPLIWSTASSRDHAGPTARVFFFQYLFSFSLLDFTSLFLSLKFLFFSQLKAGTITSLKRVSSRAMSSMRMKEDKTSFLPCFDTQIVLNCVAKEDFSRGRDTPSMASDDLVSRIRWGIENFKKDGCSLPSLTSMLEEPPAHPDSPPSLPPLRPFSSRCSASPPRIPKADSRSLARKSTLALLRSSKGNEESVVVHNHVICSTLEHQASQRKGDQREPTGERADTPEQDLTLQRRSQQQPSHQVLMQRHGPLIINIAELETAKRAMIYRTPNHAVSRARYATCADKRGSIPGKSADSEMCVFFSDLICFHLGSLIQMSPVFEYELDGNIIMIDEENSYVHL